MNLTPTEMVSELRYRLHIDDSDRILLWLNESQDEIEKERDDWLFCIDYANSISATDGTAIYELDSDFDHFLAVWNDTDDKPMEERSLDWLRDHDPDLSSEGSPDYYVLLGPTGASNVHQIQFVDTPDDSYTIKYDYYKKLPALSLTSNTPSLVPDHTLLMLMAESRGRIDNEEEEDYPVIQGLQAKIQMRLAALRRHNVFRPDRDPRVRPAIQVTGDGHGAFSVYM